MIVYFSGTGNSRFCGETLARQLGDECRDSFYFIRDGVRAELTSTRPWVFVSPTYAWRIPRIFAEFLRNSDFSGSREAYFLMTCGDGVGNAARFLPGLCREKGLTFRGLFPVIMPENYIAMFSAPEEPRAREIVKKALPVLDRAARIIRAGEEAPPVPVTLAGKLESGPVNPLFYRFAVKDRAFAAGDRCIGCGKCAERCVLRNITLENGRPRWGGHCTHCMACITLCPTGAIEYGQKSLGQPRYRCPDMDKGE